MKAEEMLALKLSDGSTIREYLHETAKWLFSIDVCTENIDNRDMIFTLIKNDVIQGNLVDLSYDEDEYADVINKMLNNLFLPPIRGELKLPT
jgi:hypothetical protein